ncbi:MAG: hypothetical protein BRD30_02715 [Bacteroidetes bacterium QH_2_63_10]|nr:MAG: hypothetical protein BRD30_02715 [Bacteroidetes bacterium QH_2_63_10]
MNTPPPFMLSRSSRRLSALAFFFTLLLAAAPVAQAQQAGYITEQAVLSQMPEMQKAQKQLQQQVQSERQQLQQKQQQLRQRMQKFQNESNMLSEQTRKERRSQLQKQQQQLQQQMQKLRQQIAQQERELLRPVIDKYRGAVEAVAQERGLDFVITEQALVYTDDAEMADVTQATTAKAGPGRGAGARFTFAQTSRICGRRRLRASGLFFRLDMRSAFLSAFRLVR